MELNTVLSILGRRLRLAVIGGGPGSFIGAMHRQAARLDDRYELVTGILSSDAERSKRAGLELGLPPDRLYSSVQELMDAESARKDGVDVVAIMTPNDSHYEYSMSALEHGFDVICDKPMTNTLDEAEALHKKVQDSGLVFCLTHNYTGYPMVKQAREMVATGKLGKIRKVVVEYPQGWLATRLEATGQKQAGWRTDPKQSGAAGCIGDVGTHAENLAEYISGLEIDELAADLTTFVKGRALDDDGNVLLRFKGGAKGVLHASQISVGEENNLNIRVYGEIGGIEWHQKEPNTMLVKWLDQPMQVYRTGLGYLGNAAKSATRVPPAHPEGYLEAFANIYKNFANAIRARVENRKLAKDDPANDYPKVGDAVRGMAFIEAVVKSSAKNAKWTKLKV